MHYAVKFAKPRKLDKDQERLTFLNELEAATRIQHPNVVRVLHVEIASQQFPPYLVMEYVEGGKLEAILEDLQQTHQLPDLPTLQKWTTDLIAGITAINAQMLHRDLKPDNILVAQDTLKISDFGLAKVIGAATRSHTFKRFGQLFYRAPEGWRGESQSIQFDMYAMGIIFFQMASLNYPFDQIDITNTTAEELREAHLFQQPRHLETIRQDIPLEFCHLVARLLEKNPAQRFADWSQVEQALNKIGNGTRTELPLAIVALIQETGRLHEEVVQRQTTEQRRKEERLEHMKHDKVQEQNLLTQLREAMDEYKAHTHFAEQVQEGNIPIAHETIWELPFGGKVTLRFFWIDPPLGLKVGQVRFAAFLQSSVEIGLNYLLCRGDGDDMYGTWKVCRVKYHPNYNPQDQRKEPFCFHTEEEMREIEVADHATHIYQTEFSDQLVESFLEIVLTTMRQGPHKQNWAL